MTVMYDGHVMAMAHSASATLGSKEEEEWEDGASWPIGHGFCCAFVHWKCPPRICLKAWNLQLQEGESKIVFVILLDDLILPHPNHPFMKKNIPFVYAPYVDVKVHSWSPWTAGSKAWALAAQCYRRGHDVSTVLNRSYIDHATINSDDYLFLAHGHKGMLVVSICLSRIRL